MADIFNMADTWNAGGTTFTAIKMNVTDTASAAASCLMDLQVGGSSRLSVGKAGNLLSADGSASAPAFAFLGETSLGLFRGGANSLDFASGGTARLRLRSLGVQFASDQVIAWSSSVVGTTSDLLLVRDAANVLALRNSTSAQTFRWYHSFTDASNRQNGALRTASGYVELAAETAGTGSDDIDVLLTPAGAGQVRFGSHSALGAESVTGFITIKDASGTARKLAVVS